MAKSRLQIVLMLGVAGIGLLVAFVFGLWGYMSLTATPIHPIATDLPTVIGAPPSSRWAAAVDEARQIVRTDVARQNLPGLSIAVGAGSEVVWAEGFGFADLDTKLPVSPGMLFRIGDVSTTLTSAGVGLLVEQGALDLDAEIQTYVPEYPQKEWPVTVRQLVAQVGGTGTDQGDEAWMKPCERTIDGLQLFADNRLRFEPGSEFRVSSYGWILVSAAVEAVAHQKFFTYMREHVFEPAGMTATRPDAEAEPIPERVTFYFPRFAGDTTYGPEAVREGDHSCYAGGGAFLSTPSDLVRFGMAIGNGALLRPETTTMLQAPQRLPNGAATGYGLGWKLDTVSLAGTPARVAGQRAKADFVGASAALVTFPERGLVVAITSNISFADVWTLALQVAETFAGQLR